MVGHRGKTLGSVNITGEYEVEHVLQLIE